MGEPEFKLLSEDEFEKNNQHRTANTGVIPFNYCEGCRRPMTRQANIWTCQQCGSTVTLTGSANDFDDNSVSNLQYRNGHKVWRISADYAKSQWKTIYDQLIALNNKYDGLKIHEEILERTASRYNDIQRLETVSNAIQGDPKKFIRRKSMKDEILAAILYAECAERGEARKKNDIADFMELRRNGFARGERILRDLKAKNKINIITDVETKDSFADRYMTALGIIDPQHRGFVKDLMEMTLELRIGVNTVVPTKAVGAIWILATRVDVPIITPELIQECCDGIKKSIFLKYVKAIEDNVDLLVEVFNKYGIPIVPISTD